MASRRITVKMLLDKELEKFKRPDVHAKALQAWYNQMQPFVPYETGVLAENVSIETDGIHFKSPQSRYLYNGMLMVSPTTGSSWAKKGEKKILTSTPLNMSHEQHPLACANWGQVTMDLKSDIIIQEIKDYFKTIK